MQKYFQGDLVFIKADLPYDRKHFPKGQQAIVLYSYAEKMDSPGRGNDNIYSVYLLKDKNTSAWYGANDFVFLDKDRFEMLPENNYTRRVYELKAERDKTVDPKMMLVPKERFKAMEKTLSELEKLNNV